MNAAEVFRQFTEAINRNDITAAAAAVHADFRIEGAGVNGIGKPEFIAVMKAQLDAFPDYSENPTDIQESDNGQVVHFVAHVRGTHKNPFIFPGKPPLASTGRTFQLPPEPAWIRVSDDKLLVYHVQPVAGGGIDGIFSQLTAASKGAA
jgi:hypothetical protein